MYDYFGSVTYADPIAQAKALVSKLKVVGFSGKVWMDDVSVADIKKRKINSKEGG